MIIESDPECSKNKHHKAQILFSACSDDQVFCRDGHCLDMKFRCDGVINCTNDNIDENDCNLIVVDKTYQNDDAHLTFNSDEMVQVDVNISVDIESMLLISELDSFLKLKLILKIVGLDH